MTAAANSISERHLRWKPQSRSGERRARQGQRDRGPAPRRSCREPPGSASRKPARAARAPAVNKPPATGPGRGPEGPAGALGAAALSRAPRASHGQHRPPGARHQTPSALRNAKPVQNEQPKAPSNALTPSHAQSPAVLWQLTDLSQCEKSHENPLSVPPSRRKQLTHAPTGTGEHVNLSLNCSAKLTIFYLWKKKN